VSSRLVSTRAAEKAIGHYVLVRRRSPRADFAATWRAGPLYNPRMASSDPEHSISTALHRKIIHIDVYAFYASVEQRDDPNLRGKPVAVGSSAERGVVAAASYEARSFGGCSAMPSVTAKRQCPDLTFVKPRFEVYEAISPADTGNLRRAHADHRASVARRGLSRRH
jgi:hypothetical protein